MTVNSPNHQVTVEIGINGTGRILVDGNPHTIEMVRVREYFGSPHVLPSTTVGKSWISVLGAEPDTEVIVEYYA